MWLVRRPSFVLLGRIFLILVLPLSMNVFLVILGAIVTRKEQLLLKERVPRDTIVKGVLHQLNRLFAQRDISVWLFLLLLLPVL